MDVGPGTGGLAPLDAAALAVAGAAGDDAIALGPKVGAGGRPDPAFMGSAAEAGGLVVWPAAAAAWEAPGIVTLPDVTGLTFVAAFVLPPDVANDAVVEPPDVTGLTLVATLTLPPEVTAEVGGIGEPVRSADAPEDTMPPDETGTGPGTGRAGRAEVTGGAEPDCGGGAGLAGGGAAADPADARGGLDIDCCSVDGRDGGGAPLLPDDTPPAGGVEEEVVEIGFWVMGAVPTARLGLDV